MLQAYTKYVRENAEEVKKYEAVARMGTIVIPKSNVGEVVTEASFSLLGLVAVINDTIIHGKTKRAGEVWSFGGGKTEDQMRVTLIRSILTFFAHCEALLEVCATKFGSRELRDRLVVTIEMMKAFFRLVLLSWFPRECIYAGGKFESHVPPTATEEENRNNQDSTSTGSQTTTSSWVGRRSGLALKVPQNYQKYLDPKGQSDILKRETTLRVFAELLHILRPVLFVVLVRRFKNKWIPFMLSLIMDLVSLRIFQQVAKVPSLFPSLTSSPNVSHDVSELRRRTALLLFYLFRTPLYELTLGAYAASLVNRYKDVRGLSSLAEMFAFQCDFYHATHFYSAAS